MWAGTCSWQSSRAMPKGVVAISSLLSVRLLVVPPIAYRLNFSAGIRFAKHGLGDSGTLMVPVTLPKPLERQGDAKAESMGFFPRQCDLIMPLALTAGSL